MATEVNKKHSPQKTLPKWAKLSKEQEYTIAQKNKKPSLVRLDTHCLHRLKYLTRKPFRNHFNTDSESVIQDGQKL